MSAAVDDDLQPLVLFGLGAGGSAAQQVGEADDTVERRADLVAHVGQERCPGLAGCFGPAGSFLQGDRPFTNLALQFLGRAAQRLFGEFALGDVVGDALQKQRAALLVAHDAGLAMNPDLAVVAGNEAILGAKINA